MQTDNIPKVGDVFKSKTVPVYNVITRVDPITIYGVSVAYEEFQNNANRTFPSGNVWRWHMMIMNWDMNTKTIIVDEKERDEIQKLINLLLL